MFSDGFFDVRGEGAETRAAVNDGMSGAKKQSNSEGRRRDERVGFGRVQTPLGPGREAQHSSDIGVYPNCLQIFAP